MPTWNYVAFDATGVCRAVEVWWGLEESVGQFKDQREASQSEPWRPDLGTDYSDQMLKRIVAFEIEITSLQGKWKLNQNHPQHLRRRVAQQLKTLGGDSNF